MEKFTAMDALVAPLDRSNVDTDQIIPKQFLRSVRRTGFGPFLFDEWRYADRGDLGMDCSSRPRNPDFPLNRPELAEAQILLARDNFGCGSSREHAVWALMDAGFRCVVAPSFGDIFRNNAYKNGLLPVALPRAEVDALFALPSPFRLRVDLESQTVSPPDGRALPFDIAPETRRRLLQGLDDIAITLQSAEMIRAYEEKRRRSEPWIFGQEQ